MRARVGVVRRVVTMSRFVYDGCVVLIDRLVSRYLARLYE